MLLSAEKTACNGRWGLRDWIAAVGLFVATAAVVLWQNAHLAVLWDMSYVLDSSVRISLGQFPYRDFPFAHAPLTFLIQAAIIHFTGRVFFHHVVYAAVVGGLGTVLAWRIALAALLGRVRGAWGISLILTASLTVLSIYSILPLPSYDCDCIFSILCALYLFERVARKTGVCIVPRSSMFVAFAAGAALVVPLFFKQNIGLPFLAVAAVSIFILLVVKLLGSERDTGAIPGPMVLVAMLSGAAATMLACGLLLHFTVGLGNYLHWTITFAAQRRLPGFRDMVSVYREPALLWMLPCVAAGLALLRGRLGKMRWKVGWTQALALGLLAAPFLWTVLQLFLSDDADDRADSLLALWPLLLVLSGVLTLFNLWRNQGLRSVIPLLVLVAIHGAFLSQQLWGSTYAIWPLLILLIAEMITFLGTVRPPGEDATAGAGGFFSNWLAQGVAAVIGATLLACGGLYTFSEERLSYVQLPDGLLMHSTLPELRGMTVAGQWLPNFEELLRYAEANIPRADGLILLPGEDPFYFATGRVPQFPVLLFDPATDPFSPAQAVEEARVRNIRWLIVKRDLQIKEDPTPERDALLDALLLDFKLERRLQGYDVYRRR
jgi:hypothetical protein